ncbi:ATP-binding protein [Streptomyces plumbiresistens]|uniref:LuxR family transcriptional regulator n=1 Tax=Streptomyces plumbiresistens TaxID=511811 RepID=A0ABP7SK79_9ACTN
MSHTATPRGVGNIGAELTSFVGRRQETTDLSRLLAVSRLVTLIGVGGVGKTRLVLRVASERRRDFRDGVWFVDLAPLDDEALLTQTVASALGLQDQGTSWPISRLAQFLHDKAMLLVVDNCEHLRDSCAILVDALLRGAPGLRVLATSRQSLGLMGEHVFPVQPLSVPEEGTAISAGSVLHYEAVKLFVERARAVRPTFELTDDNVRAVTAVCRRLDGIPLAIELAAARVRALSVNDLLERLEDRFHLLTGGSKAVLPRHQTLRELIGWSWDLCSPEEQTLWARVSMFPSEFDFPAAEAICVGGTLDRRAILDVLTGLVEKTIVTVQEHGGGVRYRMLETLREYGRAQLELAAEVDEVREKHRAYFRGMATVARANWFSARQKEWLDWFRLDHSNLRMAVETSFDEPALVDSGIELVSDLWVFWFASGRTPEARHWLDRGLRSPSISARARTGALARCAYLCVIQQDLVAVRSITDQLENAAAEDWDPADGGWSTAFVLALAAMSEGELARADELLGQAYEADSVQGDLQWVQDIRFCMALVKAVRGDLTDAEAIGQESIRTADSHGEVASKSYMLWCLGFTAWRAGQPDEAVTRTREALRLGRMLEEDPFVTASCFELLAWIAAAAGESESSACFLGAAETIWSRSGAFFMTIRQLKTYRDECTATLHAAMGEDRFVRTVAAGRGMSADEAIAQALGESRVEKSDRGDTAGILGALTRRESEVADLVAQGLTNKEIAARLVISQRTAEAHVERILNKLGFTSRVQVAAWVVEQRGPVAS